MSREDQTEADGSLSGLTGELERAFELLHGIEWGEAAFSVRACWTDAWLTATGAERKAAELRCARTPVLIDGHHAYTALSVQTMMMNAVSMRSNAEIQVAGCKPVGPGMES